MLPNATLEEAASFVFTLNTGMVVQAEASLWRAELQKFVMLTMMACLKLIAASFSHMVGGFSR